MMRGGAESRGGRHGRSSAVEQQVQHGAVGLARAREEPGDGVGDAVPRPEVERREEVRGFGTLARPQEMGKKSATVGKRLSTATSARQYVAAEEQEGQCCGAMGGSRALAREGHRRWPQPWWLLGLAEQASGGGSGQGTTAQEEERGDLSELTR